jgi:LacI family repressor for deo operon, udp, cdd, tsx, nupC, and nupG
MPTITDVAREAGVGIGTVSRVINGSPLVAEATRERVLAVIRRLGYQPSPIARAFGRRRTDKLEVLVPLFAQSFVLEILQGIEDALADTDYALIIRTVDGGDDRDRVFQDCCVRGQADGVLVVWMAPTEDFVGRMSAESFPAVLLNSEHPRLWSVGTDHDAAALAATMHCVDVGHRDIALVDRREDPFNADSSGICLRGYRQALRNAGLSSRRDYERLADLGARGGAAALQALLALRDPPTAIVAGSESQAIGVLAAARALGRRVPEDLSIVGYNDTEITRDLGLTTVRVPLRELGRRAAETLVAVLAEPAADPVARYVSSELVVRATCGPPPASTRA